MILEKKNKQGLWVSECLGWDFWTRENPFHSTLWEGNWWCLRQRHSRGKSAAIPAEQGGWYADAWECTPLSCESDARVPSMCRFYSNAMAVGVSTFKSYRECVDSHEVYPERETCGWKQRWSVYLIDWNMGFYGCLTSHFINEKQAGCNHWFRRGTYKVLILIWCINKYVSIHS